MAKYLFDDGGVFANFCNMATNGIYNQFVKLKTHEERFTLALKTLLRSSAITAVFKCKTKLTEHSIEMRQKGNKSFGDGEYYKALREYTESIIYATDSSEELALAYANRSAALLSLDKYEDCIKDIDRALEIKYPDKLKSKLYKRKGMCLVALGRPGALSSFQQALTWLDKTDLNQNERNKQHIELISLIWTSEKDTAPTKNAPEIILPKLSTTNPRIPSASDAVTIKYSKKYGRHLVATRKIKPGELLIAEKPFCQRLYSKYLYTNCSYCVKSSCAMIPTNCCVNVAYCSEACRDKAWDEYHEVECPILGMLSCLDISDAVYLSLRMAIVATKKGTKIEALKQELINIDREPDPCAKLYSDDGKLHCEEYRSVYTSDLDQSDHTLELKLISEADSIAAVVCLLAKETNMFGERLPLNIALTKNSDVTFIGGLMFKQRDLGALLKTHKFADEVDSNLVMFGDSLRALGSLMNHSCDANTKKLGYADLTGVYFAIYPIEEGEQIFDNYGPEFQNMPTILRQASLVNWNFCCDCVPCRADWPQMDKILSYKLQKLTRQNKKKLDQAMAEFEKCGPLRWNDAMGNPSNTLIELVKLIEMLFTLAKRPCRELIIARDILEISHVIYEGPLVHDALDQAETEIYLEAHFLELKKDLLRYTT